MVCRNTTPALIYYSYISAPTITEPASSALLFLHHTSLSSSSSSSSSSTNFIATQVLNKTSEPLCVTYYTTAVMSMLLWPTVCIAVWSAEQFCLQCTLECPQRRQRRDRWRQHIPNLCRGNAEGAIADGPVQRPWNMQRRWRYRSQTPTWLDIDDPL